MRNFHRPGRSVAYGTNGMAATSSVPATLAAVEVLRAGGNAADAAVAASAALCVCEPHMTGIGGDCFALVGKPDGEVAGLNGSGRAGLAADGAWLERSGLSEIDKDSVHAVTVPGAIDAWDRLLSAHGTMGFGEVLQPAIALAEGGVPIGDRTASDWAGEVARLSRDDGARKHLIPNGRAPHPGEVVRFPALAGTLRAIAAQGRDAFYRGEIADDIVSCLAQRGSLLTKADFERHGADWVEPIGTTYAGREILEIPPNGQGLTALIALNVLKRFDLGKHAPDSAERRHLEIEAIRLAWVARDRHIGDSSFSNIPVEELLSDETADALAARVSLARAVAHPEAVVPMPHSDTVYLCVVDRDRLAVSFINSVYDAFGVGIVAPRSGVTLQNRGACFVTKPGHPNCIGPGKRPLHTIIPAMVRAGGRVEMPFGVMGGAYQPMGHVAVMVNRYVYGMDVQEAIDYPRAFPANGAVGIEDGVGDSTARALEGLGHRVQRVAKPFGGGQAICIDRERGVLAGGSDPRKDGAALGY